MKYRVKFTLVSIIIIGLLISLFFLSRQIPVLAQQPTGSVPTVTGTPSGPIATVVNADGANVRAGPNSVDYEIIGPSLIDGQQVPALGRSPGGDWIQIYYLGVP